MHRDRVCPCMGEGLEIRIAGCDHQVYVEHLAGMPSHGFDHIRSYADVGYEVPVHHVDMDPVGARGIDGPHLLAETREIGRKDGWRDNEWASQGFRYVVASPNTERRHGQ